VREGRGEGSFALVSTLLIVAVMALGALAFFQAARMDRLVTRNTADRVRAELAAESGLAVGRAAILTAITNGRISTNQWNYVSGHLSTHPQITASASNAEANAFAFVAQMSPADGSILATNFLVSTSATERLDSAGTNRIGSTISGPLEQCGCHQCFWHRHHQRSLRLLDFG